MALKYFFNFPLILALIVALFTVNPLSAYGQGPDEDSHNVAATLVASHTQVTPGQVFYLALKLEHAPGWHTYWRNPGDSGQPPAIEWQQTDIQPEDFTWPTPEVIPTPPLTTYGYSGVVYLPMAVSVPKEYPGSALEFKGTASWLECKDICLPATKNISVSVKVREQARASAAGKAIEQTLMQRVPREASGWQTDATYGPDVLELTFTPSAPLNNRDIRFLPYETGIIENSAQQTIEFDAPTNTYTLQVPRNTFTANAPSRLEGILIHDRHRSFRFNAEAGEGAVAALTPIGAGLGLLVALGLAFLGGLLLNLMPCVLPVLALKITHLVSHAQKEAPWHHGMAFALGVISTFLVLAGVLIALQAGGQALGWGFQLQNPVFVLIISIILLAVALDLMGVFEIGAGLSRLGGKGEHVRGKTGSFLTGVLATIVATPCTAPFMGSALAFTLGKPAVIVLTVFAVLGLGLAAPYVLLTIFPRLLRFIPKPGPWMITFKQILAFPILATILWLLWVLGSQVGPDGLTIGLLVLLVVAFGLWLWGRFGQGLDASPARAFTVLVITLGLLSGACYFGAIALKTLDASYSQATGERGVAEHTLFRPGLPEELQQQGQASFVIFTADWCITCKVNERVVIASREIQAAFEQENIEVIVADWTRRDDMIGNTLKKHGRAGVPFYLYYPPEAGAQPKPLPELLTQDIVLRTIYDK